MLNEHYPLFIFKKCMDFLVGILPGRRMSCKNIVEMVAYVRTVMVQLP